MLFNISLEFKKGSQADLISFSSTVYQSMSTDNQFVDYKPHVDMLKTKNDALTVAIANAKLGGSDRIAAKNDCMAAVIMQLVKIGGQLEHQPMRLLIRVLSPMQALKCGVQHAHLKPQSLI